MDLFKIQLDRLLKKDQNIENFLLKKTKNKKNISKVRENFSYIVQNTSYTSWLTSYILISEDKEIFEEIIKNYELLKQKDYDMNYVIMQMTKLPNEEIKKYIDMIITKIDRYDLNILLDNLRENEEVIEYLIENYIKEKEIGLMLTSSLLSRNIYIDKLKKYENKVIENNIDKAYSLQKTNRINEETEKIISQLTQNNEEYLDNTIDYILQDIYGTNYKENKDKYKIAADTIKIIIKEICQSEQVNYGNIKYLGSGTFSYVVALGDKVLKMGKRRIAKEFPNNPYIIAPLLRETIPIDQSTDLFLEVTERVDTTTKVTEEDLYQLYKKLRNVGLVWTDLASRNVGILLKDNKIHWHESIKPNDTSLELEKYREAPPLKKGELVILDADHIYDENLPIAQRELKRSQFEQRYQEELRINRNITEERFNTIDSAIEESSAKTR